MTKPTPVEVDFCFDRPWSPDCYDKFIPKLRSILSKHKDEMSVWGVQGQRARVLAKQTNGKEPRRWIHINLVGHGNMRTTLAVRDDNLYLHGFRNGQGVWYQFGFICRDKPMVHPDARFLECSVEYADMVGSPWELVSLELGERFVEEAVNGLSGYAGTPGDKADDEIKRYLAGLIVIICEAARMDQPYKSLIPSWHNRGGSQINKKEVNYILNWGHMSEALLRWNKGSLGNLEFPDCLKRIGITSPCRALEIVRLLLYRRTSGRPTWERKPYRRVVAGGHGGSEEPLPQPKRAGLQQQSGQGHGQLPQQQLQEGHRRDGSDPQQQKTAVPPGPAEDYEVCGRPLVEVFAVRARYNFVGSVAIFDGRRGQIIYKNDSIQDSSPPDDGELHELLMMGPYAAVTAYGSFTIEVEIEEDDYTDTGELNWDCYDESNDYDKPITRIITTMRGGHKVEVTFAVLDDAVEANLEVSVCLPGVTAPDHVFGEITARCRTVDGPDLPRIVLLDPKLEREALLTNGCGSLPLARSVLAVPFERSLQINATLYHEPPKEGVRPFFHCEDLKLTLGYPPTSELKVVDGVEFEVQISSPDIRPLAGPVKRSITVASRSSHYASCPFD